MAESDPADGGKAGNNPLPRAPSWGAAAPPRATPGYPPLTGTCSFVGGLRSARFHLPAESHPPPLLSARRQTCGGGFGRAAKLPFPRRLQALPSHRSPVTVPRSPGPLRRSGCGRRGRLASPRLASPGFPASASPARRAGPRSSSSRRAAPRCQGRPGAPPRAALPQRPGREAVGRGRAGAERWGWTEERGGVRGTGPRRSPSGEGRRTGGKGVPQRGRRPLLREAGRGVPPPSLPHPPQGPGRAGGRPPQQESRGRASPPGPGKVREGLP